MFVPSKKLISVISPLSKESVRIKREISRKQAINPIICNVVPTDREENMLSSLLDLVAKFNGQSH